MQNIKERQEHLIQELVEIDIKEKEKIDKIIRELQELDKILKEE